MYKLFLVITCLLFLQTNAQPKPEIVSITKFGIKPNTGKNLCQPFQLAMDYCAKSKNSVTISFPKGRYDFYPDGAVQRKMFISNTSNETEDSLKMRVIGFYIDNKKNITIDGNGSMFVFHGKMTTIVVHKSENITLKNLSINFERPTMSEFTVLEANEHSVKLAIHPDSKYTIREGKLTWIGEGWEAKNYHCIRMDTVANKMFYANGIYEAIAKSKVSEIKPFLLECKGDFTKNAPVVGNVYSVRDPIRDQVGGFLAYSKNLRLENVKMHYMHGLGIVSQFSENLIVDNFAVEPVKGSRRTIASFADGLHFSGCKGNIVVQNSRFSGLHDDPINVHGTHLQIIEKRGTNQVLLRFMHHQSYGFDAFFANDSIGWINARTLNQFGSATVKAVERVSDREVLLTLNEAVPTNVKAGDVVENITWTPNFTLKNNRFSRTNTRGLLVTTRRKVEISNNTFYKTGMSGILVADDALSWFESGTVKDMYIHHNTFVECGYNSPYTILIAPENNEQGDEPVHKNFRIENNRFVLQDDFLLRAKSFKLLSFKNNTIYTKNINVEINKLYMLENSGEFVEDENTLKGYEEFKE